MHLFLSLLVLSSLSCSASPRLRKEGAATNPVARLRAQIQEALQDSALAQTRTGIKVVSLKSGEVLFERDSRLLFHPASNMKLLTTATALEKLGPNFRFKTLLLADSLATGDSLIVGNLYLKGFGNPDLSTSDLRWMVQKLWQTGIRKISGDLVCDESYFDDLYLGSGWMWDDASDEDFSPISGLAVNHNCVTVVVRPGTAPGDSLSVQLQPPTSFVRIENLGVTVDSTDTTRLKAFRVERKWQQHENTVVVDGGLTPQSEPEEFVIEIENPALYTGTLFAELLAAQGIRFAGRISPGVAPDSLNALVEHRSPPLSVLILHTNKESDNLYAEMLLKTLGAQVRGLPGTAEKGIAVINAFLDSVGIDTTTYELADGSGVSRYNVVSPEHIIELLRVMNADFRVQAEFKASLPIAGVDGTLKERMQDTAAAGKLRAKTGSLRGVSTLSGYTTTAEGEPLAFSLMMEHFVGSTSKIRQIQDRIGALLSSFRRGVLAGKKEN